MAVYFYNTSEKANKGTRIDTAFNAML
ncbi:hypothetical protein VAEU17_4280185 [Vibrio aestuarianus]|nr:hypothetical protein VAEU17_4280185 [Vibrio aestuarianus]